MGATRVNQLFYGDNLNVLRASIKDETVALIYLDPTINADTQLREPHDTRRTYLTHRAVI
jgi:hypothetical protein